MDLTACLDRESTRGSLKEKLIDVYSAQENLIHAQQEAMMKLLHENTEQENMINTMMREHIKGGAICK